jgi:hypothetical protein
LYGAYTALTDGVARAWVADLLPATALGRGIGLYHGLTGAGVVVAGVWAGIAWHGTGRVPLVVSGACAAALACALVAYGLKATRSDFMRDCGA